MRILLISMLLSFVLTNCPTQEDTDLVEMQAAVNPEEAGEVNPPIGTYISGREITVVTIPANEQWEFTGWTGDTTAQEDSLTFEITENMELTANYEVPAQAFSNQITVTDGNNSKELVFGMHSDATADLMMESMQNSRRLLHLKEHFIGGLISLIMLFARTTGRYKHSRPFGRWSLLLMKDKLLH